MLKGYKFLPCSDKVFSKRFEAQRQQLQTIYRLINDLFRTLQHGGTYFGHQEYRILAYVEYSIYIMPRSETDWKKTYDIGNQRALYLQSLRQLVEDEVSIDMEILGEDKTIQKTNLNGIINQLEPLLSTIFYLRRAQEFHYGHYEYH